MRSPLRAAIAPSKLRGPEPTAFRSNLTNGRARRSPGPPPPCRPLTHRRGRDLVGRTALRSDARTIGQIGRAVVRAQRDRERHSNPRRAAPSRRADAKKTVRSGVRPARRREARRSRTASPPAWSSTRCPLFAISVRTCRPVLRMFRSIPQVSRYTRLQAACGQRLAARTLAQANASGVSIATLSRCR